MKALDGNKRRSIRFKPDKNTVAKIDTRKNIELKDFDHTHIALVCDESFKGCSLVSLGFTAKRGDHIIIQVGNLKPMNAEVRWVVNVDSQISRVGLLYLE